MFLEEEEGCLNNSNILVTRALARRSMRKVNDAEFQPPNNINSNSSILAVLKILGLACSGTMMLLFHYLV